MPVSTLFNLMNEPAGRLRSYIFKNLKNGDLHSQFCKGCLIKIAKLVRSLAYFLQVMKLYHVSLCRLILTLKTEDYWPK